MNVLKVKSLYAVINQLAPAAIGPYSQAVLADGMLYISGQLGIDPLTSDIVHGGVVAQARQAFKNVHEILIQAKAEFKVSCLLPPI